MVKLTSKVQKNMFEHAKNRKKFPGSVSPDPPKQHLRLQRSKSPPNFFHLPTALSPIEYFLIGYSLAHAVMI